MRPRPDLLAAPAVEVTTQGQLAGIDDYPREKIGGLHRLTHQPGELTPSLKVKRAVVAERNKELLDSFYL